MMVLHQRPTGGGDYDYYHFHIEFYPPLRTATKLKYLAGSESGAGMFINDTLAEEKAAELRGHVEPVIWQTKGAGHNSGGNDAGDEQPPEKETNVD
jgi:galactose-1-phosphate uridylyltransferase